MKTKKFLSVVLTGALALGAAGHGVNANAFCVDGKCELNKPYELNCNMDLLEAINHLCKDSQNSSICIGNMAREFKVVLGMSSSELALKFVSRFIGNNIVIMLGDVIRKNNTDNQYCKCFGCKDKSPLQITKEVAELQYEIYRWAYHCISEEQ